MKTLSLKGWANNHKLEVINIWPIFKIRKYLENLLLLIRNCSVYELRFEKTALLTTGNVCDGSYEFRMAHSATSVSCHCAYVHQAEWIRRKSGIKMIEESEGGECVHYPASIKKVSKTLEGSRHYINSQM